MPLATDCLNAITKLHDQNQGLLSSNQCMIIKNNKKSKPLHPRHQLPNELFRLCLSLCLRQSETSRLETFIKTFSSKKMEEQGYLVRKRSKTVVMVKRQHCRLNICGYIETAVLSIGGQEYLQGHPFSIQSLRLNCVKQFWP